MIFVKGFISLKPSRLCRNGFKLLLSAREKPSAQPEEPSKATAFAVRAANAERVKRVPGKKHLEIKLKFKLSDMAVLTAAGLVMQL